MFRRYAIVLAVLGVLLSTSGAKADIITFRYTGTGSGTIGATAFSDKQFTITAVGNTNATYFWTHGSSTGYTTPDDIASISIEGVGDYSFTSAIVAFVNHSSKICGFRAAVWPNTDYCYAPASPAWGSWDMLSSVGPVTGTTTMLQWSNQALMTSGGRLSFTTASGPGSFQATVTAAPEPSAMVLLGVGVLAVLARCWRRRSV